MIRISPDIMQEIAERIVEMSDPSYHGQGTYYVVNGTQVLFREATAPRNPWPDGASFISVLVLATIAGDEADFWGEPDDSLSDDLHHVLRVDFALNYVPDAYDPVRMEAYYQEHSTPCPRCRRV